MVGLAVAASVVAAALELVGAPCFLEQQLPILPAGSHRNILKRVVEGLEYLDTRSVGELVLDTQLSNACMQMMDLKKFVWFFLHVCKIR